MIKSIAFACLLLAAAPVGAQIAVDLPALTGSYDDGHVLPNNVPRSRAATVVLPSEIATVDDLTFVLSGTMQLGTAACYDNDYCPCDPDTSSYAKSIGVLVDVPALDVTLIAHAWPTVEGFSGLEARVKPFVPSQGVDFNLLIGQDLDVYCGIEGEFLTCDVVADMMLDLTSVRLEVDGTVPNETKAWGAVKALYR